MTELVSLVIPCRNDAALLHAALTSAYAQSQPFHEVIVVDNASSDDTAAVAHSFGARVVREDVLGVTAAASAGFDAATGTLIARCDADTRLPRNWVADVVEAFDCDDDALAVTGPADFYGLGAVRNRLARGLYLQPYFLFHRHLFKHEVLFGSNCAVRASAWREVAWSVPRHDADVHDDLDLSLRLAHVGRISYRRDLVVTVSPRPVQRPLSLLHRLRRAAHTYRVARHTVTAANQGVA